jgi:hypothetical protein
LFREKAIGSAARAPVRRRSRESHIRGTQVRGDMTPKMASVVHVDVAILGFRNVQSQISELVQVKML